MQKNLLDRSIDGVVGFALAVVRSCFDLGWYRALRTRPLGAAVAYAVAFHAAIALYATALLASYLFGASTAFIVHVNRVFPEDAAFRVDSGHLSTNLAEPFEAGGKWFRVVIDTSVEGHVVPPKYDDIPGFLVGRDAIFFPKPHYTHRSILTQQRYVRMEKLSEFAVTKRELLEWFGSWGAFTVLGALIVFGVGKLALSLIKTAMVVAVAAALASLAGHVFGARRPFGTWFATGLHAVTLPILAGVAMDAIGVSVPLVDVLIFLGFFVVVIVDDASRGTGGQRATA